MSKKEKARALLQRLESLERQRFSVSGGGQLASAIEQLLNDGIDDAKQRLVAGPISTSLNKIVDELGVLKGGSASTLEKVAQVEERNAKHLAALRSDFLSRLDAALSNAKSTKEIGALIERVASLTLEFTDKINALEHTRDLMHAEVEKLRQDLALAGESLSSGRVEIYRDLEASERGRTEDATRIDERFSALSNRIAALQNTRGGNANRNITLGGASLLTKYTDINFIAGSNLGIAASVDDTTKRTNLTFYSTGGAAATIYVETPVGAIDGVNKDYTTLNTITTVIGLNINGGFIHPSEYAVTGAGYTMTTALPASLSGTGYTISYV